MTFTLHNYVPSMLDMADTALRPLDSTHDLRSAFPIMQQLRPHLTSEADFLSRIERMSLNGYRLIGAYDSGVLVGLAGYRLQENLVYGSFLYVDDLVTAAAQRGGQWGSRLLQALERLARASGCARLVLDTGLANARAQRFYFREGLLTGALRFQKQFDTP